MLLIGSHVSFANKQLLSCVEQTIFYGANCFMFYTGAPANTIRRNIEEEYTENAYKLMKDNNILINNVFCHAPYIINLANRSEERKYRFSVTFLKGEITRCIKMGITKLIIHPGSAVTNTKEVAIKNIIDALNEVIDKNSKVMILLEMMSGKGSEIGSTIAEIKAIIDGVKYKEHIGVCIDTCHLNDSGYSIEKIDEFLKEFDKEIGIEKIKCVHLNDSKNLIATHKDRHENIGFGTIGFDNLLNLIYHEKLKDIPKILETPWISESKTVAYPPYKFEISMIKSKIFDPDLIIKIKEYYKNP